MADVTPDYKIERKKIEVSIGQLQQNRLASELREMQLESDLEKTRDSLASIDAAIAERQQTLDSLPED